MLCWTSFFLRNFGERKIGGGISTTSGSINAELFPDNTRFLFGERENEGKLENVG